MKLLARHSRASGNPAKAKIPRSGQNLDVVPLRGILFNNLDSHLRGITSDLLACGLSRMASGSINDEVWCEREI